MKNIWISGSINSGKTTVSKILSKELKMVLIELDTFSSFVEDFLEFKEYVSLNYEIAPKIINLYNDQGYGVIVVYPILESKNTILQKTCKHTTFFTIDPGVGVALSDRGDRKLTDWEKERVLFHYDNSVNNLSFGHRIETHNITPQQTSQKIINLFTEHSNSGM